MAVRITNFGGLYPKASPRALPDDGAQEATDLLPGTREFRPLGQDTTVVANTGIPNPKTIYRLARTSGGAFNTDMTTGWIVKAAEMSFVKAQINDDTTERTYATFDDGSAPPRSYTASDTVTGRQLGVPAPTSAVTLSVNVTAQFSTDDRAAAIKAAVDYFKTLSRDPAMLVPTWFGAGTTTQADFRPGTGTNGYVDRDVVPTLLNADLSQQLRVFRLASTGGADTGAISNTYDSANGPAAYQWVLDPSLGGFYQTSRSTSPLWPSWAGTNNDHWCLAFTAYATAYTPDGTAIRAALAAMQMPGAETPTALFTSGQLDDIITAVADALDAKWTAGAPFLTSLKAEVDTMHTLLGGGGTSQRNASIAAFYALSDVSTEINNAVTNLAETLFGMASQAAAYVDFTGYPGGA
jgi:hypothetical protein